MRNHSKFQHNTCWTHHNTRRFQTNLITELRRRRVFRVAAFYGGIAFVIIQIIDGTFALMGVPEWVGRLMVVLLALGFPVSMILAWVFDITDEGIVRTKGRPADAKRKHQPLIGNKALASIALAAVLALVWSRYDGGDHHQLTTIAVLPFQNYSEDDSHLVGMMARQVKLKKEQFLDLVNCPLSREEYLQFLYDNQYLMK